MFSHKERQNILPLAKQWKIFKISSDSPSESFQYQPVIPRFRGVITKKVPMLIAAVRAMDIMETLGTLSKA